MEMLKEGLKRYLVREEIKNSYFLSMEYEMIHQNQLSSFLPMQLRQENGKMVLLYEVTGGATLVESTESLVGYSFCRELLRAIRDVLAVTEEYMLQVEHICFAKDSIYIKKDGMVQFMYCPDEHLPAEEGIEELFAWLLSRLDYEDKQGVEFVYSTYNAIRKSGISKKKIEEILRKEGKEKKKEPAVHLKENTYKKTLEEPVSPKKKSERPEAKIIDSKVKQRLTLIGCGISVLWILYFGSIGWRYGFSGTVCRYLLAGGILFIVCLLVYPKRQRRKRILPDSRPRKSKDNIPKEKDNLNFLEEETRVLSIEDMPEFYKK